MQTVPSFDLLLRLEARFGESRPRVARGLARWRTKRFDTQLARRLKRIRPEVLFAFSDVGSMAALPLCRRLGIKTIVSMVHGDVREEQGVLARETASSPEFMPIYLGNGPLDLRLLAWLHERRLCDLALADRVLVPSNHIAETLVRHGTPAAKIRVIPYAADCRRFRPLARKAPRAGLHVPLRRRNQPSQGNQVSARSLAANPSSRLAAPASRSVAGRHRPARALPGHRRAAGPGLALRDARAHGFGRCLRVPVAVRRLCRRDLRGTRLRLAQRGHTQAPVRSSATVSKASSSPRARSTAWRSAWNSSETTLGFVPRWPKLPALAPWPSTGRVTTTP